VSSLKTFSSGVIDSGTAATTSFGYNATTGLLSSKTYAGEASPSIGYVYDSNLRLQNVNRSGSNETLAYDPNSGDMNSDTYDDPATQGTTWCTASIPSLAGTPRDGSFI